MTKGAFFLSGLLLTASLMMASPLHAKGPHDGLRTPVVIKEAMLHKNVHPEARITRPTPKPVKPIVLSPQDRTHIAFVVQSHISALSLREADVVHALASKNISSHFKDPKHLLKAFVRRHRPVAFAKHLRMDSLLVHKNTVIQNVYVTDIANLQWFVSYSLKQNDIGLWQIAGCYIRLAPGTLT